jgi:hypothetical protein
MRARITPIASGSEISQKLRRKFFLPGRFLKKLPGKILRLLTFAIIVYM